jgi:hypothetical protein
MVQPKRKTYGGGPANSKHSERFQALSYLPINLVRLIPKALASFSNVVREGLTAPLSMDEM